MTMDPEQARAEGRAEGLQLAEQIRTAIGEGWPPDLSEWIAELAHCVHHYMPDDFPVLKYDSAVEAVAALFERYKADRDYIQQEWDKDKQRLWQARIQRDVLLGEVDKLKKQVYHYATQLGRWAGKDGPPKRLHERKNNDE